MPMITPRARTVFIHGRGRSGARAWPLPAQEAAPDHVFLERTGTSDQPERDADRVIDLLTTPGHVVGHSYGTVTAVLAAQRRPDRLRSLVLIEPACYDLARGGRYVERHVRAMAPVFAVADDPDVDGPEFLARFAAGMGDAPPDLDTDKAEQVAARIRTTPAPWEVDLRGDTPRIVPTLVITGEERSMYEEVAAALAAKGAERLVLPRAGHRPQDTEEGMAAMRDFWARH
ncbi:alpha/beta fold hydrolase [Janibacter corallicola]|uniref:alpha/beta fold hydrolase n=1 Tax=Janibacter corallicola TaxID=415212 RepID=UPI0008369228|nr:alpha/beta hydrolase [Janibacter corallicola]